MAAMEIIEPKLLISEELANITRKTVKDDNILDIYIHNIAGPVTVSGGSFGSQEINTVAWSTEDERFVKDIYTELDELIDLDFNFTPNQSAADIAIFLDTAITIDDGDTLGLAVNNNTQNNEYFWEIFLNEPQFEGDKNYFYYALLHEIGHTLGLEHPFENNDGDVANGITDPWESLFPDETVMAYRSPAGELWPNAYTSNDKAALIEIWGHETTHSTIKPQTSNELLPLVMKANSNRLKGTSQADWIIGNDRNNIIKAKEGNDYIQGSLGDDRLNGNNGSDTLKGGSGDDIIMGGKGSDKIHGGRGSDTIHGGKGADVLYGNFGQNTFSNAADGSIDIINIQCGERLSKKHRKNTKKNKSIRNHVDIIKGLDKADQIHLIGTKNKSITIQTASALGKTGLGIFANESLEALYIGDDISSSQLLNMTTNF